ncbi:MAG: hypothetical protein H0T85_05695 [Geodermatophilaceae bacterium]|nr:hypothetical protein [Geodermatophilaceae bacterium]
MADLIRRLQVLLDESRWTRLESRAQQEGASVASLVRSAIDLAYPDAEWTVAESAKRFLARAPVDIPAWEELKAELEDDLARDVSS